jgi:hypothetical protein
MIRKPPLMLFRSPAKRGRLLAALLLASLAWGTTAEFNHHHGGRAQSLLSTTQAQDADASSVRIESSKTNGTSSSSKTGAECFIRIFPLLLWVTHPGSERRKRML